MPRTPGGVPVDPFMEELSSKSLSEIIEESKGGSKGAADMGDKQKKAQPIYARCTCTWHTCACCCGIKWFEHSAWAGDENGRPRTRPNQTKFGVCPGQREGKGEEVGHAD